MQNNATGLTPDDIIRLQAPLPLAEHEARAKGKSTKGDKQQWLIYINQEGVIPLLNSIDPNWTWEVRETVRTTKYVTVTGRMSLKGVSRDGTGGNSPNGTNAPVDEDTEKGAETDALKRAAVKFGIGLYLRGVAAIWLPYSEASKPWELEKQALAEFEKWYRKEFSAQPARPTPPQPTVSPASTAPSSANGGSPDEEPLFTPPPATLEMPQIGHLNMTALLNDALAVKLVKHRKHFINLINLLKAEGTVRDAMDNGQVLTAIRAHEASKETVS